MPGEAVSGLTGTSTALVIVHLQPDIITAGTAFGSVFASEVERVQVVAQARRAADALRASGGTVVAARIAFAADGRDLHVTMPLLAMAADAGALIDSTPGADVVPELALEAEDLTLTHHRPGPFTGTALDGWLRARGITDVVVCGTATNASVEATVRQAADLGYRTHVLADACSAADRAAHEASLASMDLFASRLTVEEMVRALAV